MGALRAWCARRPDRAVTAFFAVVAYLPILFTSPGRVSADTKTYLTVDPGRLLTGATSMWDPSVGAGTVPHQNIGYLFPLGPYYWVMDRFGVPDWLTQRLLWGTLVFAAAYGAYRLARWLGWKPDAAVVVGFAYGFSPYLLSYLARLSVILAPWAALPWMILLAAEAARTRSWRPAAQFALVVALIGSVNATALVLAGLGPVIWLIVDVLSGRVIWSAAVRAAAKIGALSAAVSVWWIVALRVQGVYGIPILRYTETYRSVASASTPAEIMRGLGYWFFYGGDRLDAWVGPSGPYTGNAAVMALGFTLAGIALLGFLAPFIGRVATALMLLVGLAVSVGGSPLGHVTPYGTLFDWFASDTTAGLALRSTPRAAPLVILALAFGLGSATGWARTRARSPKRWGLAVPVGMIALLALQLFPWFAADALTPSIERDETLPAYETDLASWLDDNRGADGAGRVWEIPAADFAYYRWGGTIDPVLAGMIDRPYLARELVPQGGAATADLLNAFERRAPEGWLEPEALAPIAERFGVDTIVTRNDLQHERFRLARPGELWTAVSDALGEPDHTGPVITDTPRIPVLDARTLAHPDAARRFPAVAAFDITPTPAVRTRSATDPIVLVGSGDGLVDLAGARLLDHDRPVLYAASLDDLATSGDFDPAMVGTDPWWVVSDSNRKQGRHWSTVSSDLGALEGAGPLQLDDDPGDNRLDVFDPAGDGVDRQTIGVHRGDVVDVRASYYGYRVAYTPEDAPRFAVDGDPDTAWRAGVFDETAGLVWEVDLAEPSTADSITVLQPITGAVNRYITEIRVTLDDAASFDVDLDERSRRLPGQPIDLPADRPSAGFSTMRIEVLADNLGELSSYIGQPGVGLAEVEIPDVTDDYVVRVPSLDAFDIVDDRGVADAAGRRLTYLLTRQRIDPATSNQSSAEPYLVREIDVAAPRTFELLGEARLSADASDDLLLDVLDDPAGAVADRRLRGSPDSRGASAVDGDPATAWQTPFDGALGATVTFEHPSSVTAGSVTVSWLADDQHSVPTKLTITGDGAAPRTVTLPATEPVDGVATATVPLDGYRASTSTIVVSAIGERTTPEYFSGAPQVLPVGIAEIRFGTEPNPVFDRAAALDGRCRDDLVTVDGRPVQVRLTGSRADALTRGELAVQACGSTTLVAGSHVVRAAPGPVSGFDIDRLVLDSVPTSAVPHSAAPAAGSPVVDITSQGSTSFDARVAASEQPSWLILEQSWNAGWTASVDGIDLGRPVLVDGYANGWLLGPSATERTVELRWTPQRTVTIALWLSLIAGVGVLALALLGRRRGNPTPAGDGTGRPSRRSLLAAGVVLVAGFALFAGPVPALAGAVVLLVGDRIRWLAPALVLTAGAIAAGAIVVLQWHYRYPPGPDWPDRFGWTASLVWIAVVAVIAGALRDAATARGRPVTDRPDARDGSDSVADSCAR